ncbi:MAG: baseplate multidomain protein megatron [Paracoccaceae bacterium]
MATLALSAAGSALGGAVGGSVLGLSGAVIGRAAGATLGRAIDARLLGQGSDPVEVGRMDRLRLMGASRGAPIPRLHGRMRLGGQVIWATEFLETRTETGGGKGLGAPEPETVEYAYSVSLAIGLCLGRITCVGRIWADGQEIAPDSLTMRVHQGGRNQHPDPLIVATEGAAPAYRGLAYVVIEDLDLGRFGNRVPQFSFEVTRLGPRGANEDMADAVRGVALMPGTGEWTLDKDVVTRTEGFADERVKNANTSARKTDAALAFDHLTTELPRAGALSLVVSWFGDDLRAGRCTATPRCESRTAPETDPEWIAGGVGRAEALEVPRDADGKVVYGGTPSDAAVVATLREARARGLEPMFYPFLLMTQMPGNGRPDPWGPGDQPVLPWRGRITSRRAPGVTGSTDGTAEAGAEVASFFGQAAPGDFDVSGISVTYTGPADWGWRRFILHYAHLCAAAGGVEAFCIGSEMRGLTRIRDASGDFPAVEALRRLARDCRAILGPGVKIGYAADWSEVPAYAPPGTDELRFHLDPLWSDDAIDFVGIDNYLPLSDWRDGPDHLDAHWGDIENPAYLAANVEGGEWFDWYYASAADRRNQVRTPITDGLGEAWVWRTKDIRSWWSLPHHERSGGTRAARPTGWVPRSKPIRFTELGCPAVDKGTNQPNVFYDPKSSESFLPHHSDGRPDDAIQMAYLRAMTAWWDHDGRNPVSPLYGGRMVDMTRAYAWAWDARPWPWFPSRTDLWTDGPNHRLGHWLTGRTGARPLSAVVAEICREAGVEADVSALTGLVRGYSIQGVTSARSDLQPLLMAHGADAAQEAGRLRFFMRAAAPKAVLGRDDLALSDRLDAPMELTSAPPTDLPGRVRIGHLAFGADYEATVTEAVWPRADAQAAAGTELSMVLPPDQAQRMAEHWLRDARVSRDTARLALPPSRADLGAGDVVDLTIAGAEGAWRIDAVSDEGARLLDLTRVAAPFALSPPDDPPVPRRADARRAGPVQAAFLDLPGLGAAEGLTAPFVALTAGDWPGRVALWRGVEDAGHALDLVVERPATVGRLLDPLPAGPQGVWDNGPPVRVELVSGELRSVSDAVLFSGANLFAVGAGPGDAEGWELMQAARADLVAPGTYALSRRLRGQAGSEARARDPWPAGSWVVAVDGDLPRSTLPREARGLTRHWRWGPASARPGDRVVRHRELAVRGMALVPLSVVHLRAVPDGAGGRDVTWISRGRVDADSWDGEVQPEGGGYAVRVRAPGGAVLRSARVAAPAYTYTAAMAAADGPGATIEVAQLSDAVGEGPARAAPL